MHEILHEILTNFWTISVLYVQTVYTQQILSKNVSVFPAIFDCTGGGSAVAAPWRRQGYLAGANPPSQKVKLFYPQKSVNFLLIFTIAISMSIEK